MIRINLLPTKKIRKQMGLKQELLLGFLLLVLTGVLLGLVWVWQSNRVERLTLDRNQKKQRLAQLKETVAEVERFKKDKELYEQRIAIIHDLEAQQSGPVHVLDELSLNIPDKLWFDSLSLKGKALTVTGKAFANIAIVDFVNNLKRSPYFQNVTLLESKVSTKAKVRVYEFKLTATVTMPKRAG